MLMVATGKVANQTTDLDLSKLGVVLNPDLRGLVEEY
jgi:hypothetical protein